MSRRGTRGYGRRDRLVRAVALIGALLYLAGITTYLLTHGGWPTPDYLIPPLMLIAVASGRGWAFVADWGPFLLLILSWQATAGLADQMGRPVHLLEPAEADRALFGGYLPTVELQHRFFHHERASWYDWAATLQHGLHFVLPVAVGWWLWVRRRRTYWRYMLSVMVLFYLGFAGYVLYPAAPPWMAGLADAIPPVHRIAPETLGRLGPTAPLSLAYAHLSANEVAAMPSLHAALPLLTALVLMRLYGPRAAPCLLYPLTMGFNLVYLGEHYVVDVLAGFVTALLAFALVWVLPDLVPLRPRVPSAPRVPLPRPVRAVGTLTLPAAALVATAVVLGSLRPAPSQVNVAVATPDAPPPVPAALALASCDDVGERSVAVQALMQGIAGGYAVYLIDLEEVTCYALAADPALPPPPDDLTLALAGEAPPPPDVVALEVGTGEVMLAAGAPAEPLVAAGLVPARRYALVVRLAEIGDADEVRRTVQVLAGLTLTTS
jgi:membrane-associated phospholipid phosphatase